MEALEEEDSELQGAADMGAKVQEEAMAHLADQRKEEVKAGLMEGRRDRIHRTQQARDKGLGEGTDFSRSYTFSI